MSASASASASATTGPSSAWLKCARCGELVYGKRWHRELGVCPQCGHHGRLTARQRISLLADDFGPIPAPGRGWGREDPLGFVDAVPYPQRLADARRRTGEDEAVVCGTAAIDGQPAVIAAMDFRFLGGSLGVTAGDLLTRSAEIALDRRIPLVMVTASGGARMQEGTLSLLQMAKVSQALAALREAGVLSVSLITDPTYGGVAASFATQADVIIAEPGARLGFAGPRVIRQTLRQELPEGFQTAEFLLTRGLLDMVEPRWRLRDTLSRILRIAGTADGTRGLRQVATPSPRQDVSSPDAPDGDAWQTIQRARDPGRPTARDYIGRVCDEFQELHGDRLGSDSPTIIGGLAVIEDQPVMVIGTQKGHTTAELAATNFGMAGPDGYRKAGRLFQLAERLRLPVVTLVDTPGAYPGVQAEENGQAWAIAENILRLTSLRVPSVTVVTGEGGSGGALALAVADRVLMLESSVYSVISPEGCAAILWDEKSAPRAAGALKMTARDLVRLGVADDVVPEPPGGSHADHAAAAAALKKAVTEALSGLLRTPPRTLVERRRERLRSIGAVGLPDGIASGVDEEIAS